VRADYKRLLTEAYDLDKPDAPALELAWYRSYVDAAPAGAPVLEVMCGSGRFLLPMLAEGVDVDGVDASSDMLEAARRHAAERGLDVHYRLHEQAAEDLSLPRRYGFAFCSSGSFGLLPNAAVAGLALRRMHDHLVPGGSVLVVAENPSGAGRAGAWTGRFWRRPDDHTIAMRFVTAYDEGQRLETGIGVYELFDPSGALVTTEANNWVRRFWEPEELRDAMTAAGFVDVETIEPQGSTLAGFGRRPPSA
jgi:SAM-dependent methyltransferase